MKKLLSIVSVLFVAITLVACGGGAKTNCKTTAAMVTDTGGVDDKSFNQSVQEAILKFEKDGKDKGACAGKYIQSTADADYVPNLTSQSGKKNDLVVAAGYKFNEALLKVSKDFPDQKYLVIDTVVESKNVTSALFAAHEGSFLAGVAAGEKAKAEGKDTLGFIGGMDNPIITAFGNGFTQGVKAVDKNMKVKVQYVGGFDDAAKAKVIANKMYSDGAYIIYQAAGNAGNGVISAAKELVKDQNKDVWVVGVDKDQYEDGKYDGDKSVILTSMLKRIDTVVLDVANLVMDGKFVGGDVLNFNVKNNGVGLPEKNPNLSDDIMKKVEEYRVKIASGEIKVSE